jgi:F-type H+-transporting ATPase subunit delta
MSKTFIVPAAIPYADALSNCSERNIEKDMKLIQNLLGELKTFENYLASPKITSKTKKEFIARNFGNKISKFSINFLYLLIDKRRINLLSSIVDKYLELKGYQRGELTVEVTSVIPLDTEQEKDLIKKLKNLYSMDEINLTIKQDPSILGGLLIKIRNSAVIDFSINGELRSISNYLGSNFEF